MDHKEELEELNREEAKYYFGGVIFVSITMVTGIIGNLHVLFIYAFRMKKSNPRIFILFLAMLDFTTCVVGMPFIIVDLRNPLTFTLVTACKILRFVNYFVGMSSSFILLVIAIDRYRKVCVPLGRQISHGAAKILCFIAFTISLSLSWPAPILYGHSTVNTTNPNITGIRCFTEDKFKTESYQAYFNYVLMIVFFGMFLILVVLYILIARAIAKHTKFVQSFKVTNLHSKSKISDSNSKSSSESKDEIILKCVKLNNKENGQSVVIKETSSTPTKTQQKHHEFLHFPQIKRTTLTMFLITFIFFTCYMPHFILKILAFVKKGFVLNMDYTERVLYNTFVWCFFINNIANAFVYGFFDNRFRAELKKMYNYILCRN